MTTDDPTERVLDVLVRIAPEIDRASVRPDASLRDEYDLDSMDFLNFVIGLHDAFGIDIPETDYPALATLAGCVRYVTAHAAPPPARPRLPHRFEAVIDWRRGADGAAALNLSVTFGARPPLTLAAPPQFKGDATRLSPEELFVASVASCQLLTYLALAARAGLPVTRYEDRPVGTLTLSDGRMRMTDVLLRPRISLGPSGDTAKARELVAAAHDRCFVTTSITAVVRIEPDIVAAGSDA